jgi:hypothetical protein
MRLGKVVIDIGYVVDLDNEEMVGNATDAMYEDVMNAVKYNEVGNWITTTDGCYYSALTGGLLESDIPDFLLEEVEDDSDK